MSEAVRPSSGSSCTTGRDSTVRPCGTALTSDNSRYATQPSSTCLLNVKIPIGSQSSNKGVGVSLQRIGVLVLSIAAIVLGVVVFMDTTSSTSDIDTAVLFSSLNEDAADSAPQQQVVNGWLANDLLEITARQNVTIIRMQGILLALIAGAVLLHFGLAGAGAESSEQPVIASDEAPPAP